MQRCKFSRKFKPEAVKLVRDRGVAVAQAARDVDLLIAPKRLTLSVVLTLFLGVLMLLALRAALTGLELGRDAIDGIATAKYDSACHRRLV
jgi:hypothetical protein